ncbi:S8 family serine peptidase [Alloyangia pacifica]|uniref:S8 family serine peptidase n=1 Tax=Alloyangia pacifica TaxID=311180 RepID=UPI001CD3E3FE|nr:S8 family serine peptidase [Alloyangia pacifica]MCA0995107.1 S8 family serine peptidase [Alloyangia pacifica]
MTNVIASNSVNDPKARYIWYLDQSNRSHLSIDIESVWEDYDGAGVKLGVIDTQIDFSHSELSGAYDTSLDYNFALGTADITPDSGALTTSHGTQVAGIIAAETNNGVGTAGIADGVTLVGLGIDYSASNIVEQVLNAINAAVDLDVVNNSWSFTSNFADNFNERPELEAALQNTAENGRDGLGTTMVFSAGNMGTLSSSNYHNFQNSPYTIAVGSVDASGEISRFSSMGSNVLISAGGRDIETTTFEDGYTSSSGTSFSAPAVTAVVALMLEANPNLGYRDIQQILALSARKEGLSDDALRGDGWQYNAASNQNGGGMHYSDSFGYGFLNAHDAVRLAESWTTQQTYANRTSVSVSDTLNESLVAGSKDTIKFSFDIDKDVTVEHVELTLDLRWYYAGDMDLYLTSPEGTTVRLTYDYESQSRLSIRDFTLSSVATMGESAKGTWTVELINRSDELDGKSGRLVDFNFTVHGDAEDMEDDIYVYTDEFSDILDETGDASRKVLVDTDGGVDTINAAAITSATWADLGTGRATLDGVEISFDADEIENIFAGDGDDTLTGSAGDNLINGGRGDDTLFFTEGNDTIIGGAGSDKLIFDTVVDTVSGFLTDAGDLMLGFIDAGYSLLSGIEAYIFSDVSMSYDDIIGWLSDEEPVITEPEPEPEPETDPSTETDSGDGSDAGDGGETSIVPEPEPELEAGEHGTEGDDRMRGSAEDDILHGHGGDDYLVGGAGTDELYGGSGNDDLRGGDGDDIMFGDAGDDSFAGGKGNDLLIGGSGNDVLRGREGNDTIYGDAGADILAGDDGADMFVFDLGTIDAIDLIADFSAAEGDQIVISNLAGAAGSTVVSFAHEDQSVYLEVLHGDELTRIAEIRGLDTDTVSISQLGSDELLVA